MRGRGGARLANAHTNPRQGHLHECLGITTQHGHGAPDGNRRGNDVAPIGAVSEHGDRHAQGGVEDGERQTDQEAHLRV